MKKLFIFLLLFPLSSTRPSAQVLQQDSLALVALYQATNGPNWKNHTNWLQGPVSKWYGVTVQGTRVYLVNLWDNGLSGTIPSEIGFLTGMAEFSLGMSDLEGPIPPSIGQLSNLSVLNLRRSGVQGDLPAALGQCTKLIQLYLGDNRLVGKIPESLANCKDLSAIQMGKNQFSGNFPHLVLDLPKLKSLGLSENQFSGPIPRGIGDLTLLEEITLSKNQFSGPLPKLDKLVNLKSLLLEENQLTGDLDTILGHHPNLAYCYLNNNRFSGKLDPVHFNAANVVRLYASDNLLTKLGDFSGWASQTKLIYLIVSNNKLDFDDLVPNAGLPANKFISFPQLTVGQDTAIMAPLGSSHKMQSPMQDPSVTYKWYLDGALLQGATGPEFNIQSLDMDSLGTYLFIASHPAFPRFSLIGANNTFKLPSATNRLLDNGDIDYTFDPFASQIEVRWNRPFQKKEVALYGMSGRCLLHQSILVDFWSHSLNQYPSGCYMLELRTEEGYAVIRFVK
ncbi:MAG: hypothetical protein IT266_01055 [Saprospiraceae bacterium]|nr:hypothetical protein [Saprospiraceae bacterium]